MKILAIGSDMPGVKDEDFYPHSEAEAKKAWELQQQGLIREIYFRDDEDSAVLVLEAMDTVHAQEILNQLPMVKHKLITFDLIPLKAYPGFKHLFKESEL